jgi:Uma2 family endonuclease
MVTLQLRQLYVPEGQRVLFYNVRWQEFEAILEELGEHRSNRLAYSQGTLEIVAPLPEHEKAKVIIGDLVKVLLDELDLNWESLGSSTFKREDMTAGIEPDDCFYIQNHALMIGRERIDLNVDPPPDLAIEIDVFSKTQVNAYEALRIPEIWRFSNHQLFIYLFQNRTYVESPNSLIFPDLPIKEWITQYLKVSRIQGTSPTLRAFRKCIREHISTG